MTESTGAERANAATDRSSGKLRAASIAALLACTVLWASPTYGQNPIGAQAAANPLAPFERLIGGRWRLDDSYQAFEWGLGRLSVKSRSYSIVGGLPKLVGEGLWFWHPGEQRIKGYFTTVGMPVAFFDYTTRFEDDRMVSELRAYDATGSATRYVEVWEFTDADHYAWSLMQHTPQGLKEAMKAVFTREQLR